MSDTITEEGEVIPRGARRVRLSRAVEAHGASLRELTLREPTGKDLRLCGMPYRMGNAPGGEAEFIISAPAVAKLISALANIPPSSVDRLPMRDFNTLFGEIMGFLGEETPPSSSTAITSAQSSGTDS